MKTIHKYPLQLTDHQRLHLPRGAEVLSVGMQSESLCLWARVEPVQPLEVQYAITVCGTGHPLPDTAGKFIGHLRMQGLEFFVFAREVTP